MDQVLALTLESMHQDASCLERVGMNLANTLTPGYKRETTLVRPFGELVNAELARGPVPAETVSDMRAGTLRSTGHSLDLALAGDGFFEVATPQGPAYTRQGDLHVDARGRLVTGQNYPVMGMGGEIVLGDAHPQIDAAGKISAPGQPGQVLDQIKVVRFERPAAMAHLGDGLLSAGAGMSVMNDAEIALRQGYLENSNVNSTQEMVQLMQTMRHFESMQKVTQGYDDMLSVAVRKLGDA